ncbi:hypothetical protein MLD38_025625 [Melastoma candidum]|uniref:Uncharacterized protein n=1 Tax=Melastoma candidum TaxID=119954 RepID=A0ACB9NZF7_9MYRT|nr:hypothetical protein MLD38_025625 [Melastoma candidum]
MEGNRVCQICNRSFSNGKAVGGHMRSHFAKLLLPTNPTPPFLNDPDLPSSHVLDAIHPKPGSGSRWSVDNNAGRESVGEVVESPAESGQGSLVSDVTFLDEEGAKCLMMLSRDAWPNAESKAGESDDEMIGRIRERAGSKGRFECETCNKVFGSYQALGGHRAGHKKVKPHRKDDAVLEYGGDENYYWSACNSNGNDKVFKCPYCDKVFGSGQALGGHKKVHVQPSDNGPNPNSSAGGASIEQREISMIDLNELPGSRDSNGETRSGQCMGERRRRRRRRRRMT